MKMIYTKKVFDLSVLILSTVRYAISYTFEKLTKSKLFGILTYLKLTDKKLGLLINFNKELLKDGIKRVINGIIS